MDKGASVPDQALVNEAATHLHPSGFDPSCAWKRGKVALAFPMDGEVFWTTAEGYTDGTFTLDRRPYPMCHLRDAWGYVISHAGTGYALCGFKGPLAEAKKLVAQVRHLDWSFAKPEDMPANTSSAALDILRADDRAVHVGEFLRGAWEPDPAIAIEARSDATGTGAAEGESAAPQEIAR